MVLIFGVLLMAALATHVLPSGSFEREEVNGQTRVVPGSYHHIDGNAASFFDVFLSVPKGLCQEPMAIFPHSTFSPCRFPVP